ncbi:MAG: glycosyltransferase family A protein [Gammaproteobacteria bacterium]
MAAVPRLSIAMPAYNCEKYIGRALESLLAQTYTDYELVISDNASTDATEQVCRSFAATDSRIRYVRRQDNIGGPGNFRYVFSLCRGEYHKWSTADDYWDPSFLAKCVPVLDQNPDVVLCYSKTKLIDAEGAPIEDYEDNLDLGEESPRARFGKLFSRIGLCNAHLGVIRRSAMRGTHLIGAERASDVHFLGELSLYGKFRLVPEFLFFRRYHQQSSSWNRGDVKHQNQYYDPKNTSHFGMHTWRKYRTLVSGVWHAPIGIGDKVGLSADLARMSLWERERLARELVAPIRQG